jgi:hypothetical protein
LDQAIGLLDRLCEVGAQARQDAAGVPAAGPAPRLEAAPLSAPLGTGASRGRPLLLPSGGRRLAAPDAPHRPHLRPALLLTDPAVVEALAAELNADPPDLVAVSGDLTMRARSREFRAARAFLDGLRAPVLAVPGNHDITSYWLHERFLDPLGPLAPLHRRGARAGLGRRRDRGGGRQHRVPRRRLPRLVAGPGRAGPAAARGGAAAGAAGGLFRVVVAHHPFLPPESAPDTRLVGRAEAALAAFAAQGCA